MQYRGFWTERALSHRLSICTILGLEGTALLWSLVSQSDVPALVIAMITGFVWAVGRIFTKTSQDHNLVVWPTFRYRGGPAVALCIWATVLMTFIVGLGIGGTPRVQRSSDDAVTFVVRTRGCDVPVPEWQFVLLRSVVLLFAISTTIHVLLENRWRIRSADDSQW